MPINERQARILAAVVDEYVRTAQPVASKIICEKYNLCVSPATVRNDMGVLEEAGLLRQPHTSAGRVPTEDGYRFYLQLVHAPRQLKNHTAPLREITGGEQSAEQRMRDLASALVRLSGETAFTSIGRDWSYYTGVAKLFEKPDFEDVETMRQISTMIDRFDEVVKGVFGDLDRNINVWIGRENPFGARMSTVLVKYEMPNGMVGTLGLVGPLRMDYQKNMRLLSEARSMMEEDV